MADELMSLANAVKRRARRERPFYNRDLPGEAPTERRRQVAAVLDRPEERRNPMRYVPDFQGVTALSRTEFKTDQREIEKSGGGFVPHPEDEDHDGSYPVKVDIGLPAPPVIDDGEARYKRFRKWSKNSKEVDLDLARYRTTIDLVRDELRKMEDRGEMEEDRFIALRRHFMEFMRFLRLEKKKCDTVVARLEKVCQAEAGVVPTKKGRRRAMREVLQRMKAHGKQMEELLTRERKLGERLTKLEAHSKQAAAMEYEIPEGDRTVLTSMGRGTLEKERRDGVMVVRFPFGCGYFPRANVTAHCKDGLGLGLKSDLELAARWSAFRDSLTLEEDEVALGVDALTPEEEALEERGAEMEVEGGDGKKPHSQLNGAAHGAAKDAEGADELVPETQKLLPTLKAAELLQASMQDLLVLPVPEGFQALPFRLPTEPHEKWEADKAEILRLEARKAELEQTVQQQEEKRRQVWNEFLTHNSEKLKHALKLFKLRSRVADIKGAHRELLLKHGFANGRLPPNLRAVVQHQLAAKGIVGARTAQLLQQQLLQQQMQQIQAAAAAASDGASGGGGGGSEGGEGDGSKKTGRAKESDDEAYDGKGKRGGRGFGAKGGRGGGKAGARGETPTQSTSGPFGSGQLSSLNTAGGKKRNSDDSDAGGSGTPSGGTPSGGGGAEDERRGNVPGIKKARRGRGR